MNAPKVVVIASYVSELIFRVDHLMHPGETLTGKFEDGLGGKGFNMTIAASRCGAQVNPILKLGSDDHASRPLAFLTTNKIDTRHATICPDLPTGIGVILIGGDGQNCIAVDSGANAALGHKEIHEARDLIRSARVVLAQLETPPQAALAAFRLARETGVITVLNPAPAPQSPLPNELLELTDILTPNESEAAALTGISSADDWQESARQLHLLGPACVAITLGKRGVGFSYQGQSELIEAHEVAAIDTSGAGDAFNGALAARIAHGDDFLSAARYATRYASLQVTRRGTATAMPHASELPDPNPMHSKKPFVATL
jgi:ribokinase